MDESDDERNEKYGFETEITQHLLEGARLFNEGEYFEAHEVWEEEWHGTVGMDKDFLQGLIQTAAVYVHLKRGNPEGVVSLASSALIYLDNVEPEKYRGVDVEYVRKLNREAEQRGREAIREDKDLILREPKIEIENSQ